MKLKITLLSIFFGFLFTVVYCRLQCPEYLNDEACNVKIEAKDGGLKYRNKVLPSWVDTRELKITPNIERVQKNKEEYFKNNIGSLIVDENGKVLQKFYLSLNVESLWIAGNHVNWQTGVADKPEASSGNHTHCSAFVAVACQKMGIYILRPPYHGQILLANAQYDWLQTKEALESGWMPVTSPNRLSLYALVQRLANTGNIIVAVIKNPDDSNPGHAALIMPKKIEEDKIKETGPVIIMAGNHNFNFISLKNGFKNHIDKWPEEEIQFYINRSKNLQIPVINSK